MAKQMRKTQKRCYDNRVRIEEVKEKLLSGMSRPSVIDFAKSQYSVSRSQAYLYVSKAEVEIREVVERDRPTWLAYHLEVRRDIRRRAYLAGDLRIELDSANSESKLLGLDVTQVSVAASVKMVAGIDPSELV